MKDYGKTLIPYGTMEDEYYVYDTENYINDINREYTQILGNYDENGTLQAAYTYGNERLNRTTEAGTMYYSYDGKGSVAILTDESGQTETAYRYDALGNTVSEDTSGNPFTYNAEQTDTATGYQYLRARYYEPESGTFVTEDTYLGNLLDPLSQNLYTYGENDPVNYQDPSGHGIFKKIASGLKKIANIVKRVYNKYIKKPAKKIKASAPKPPTSIFQKRATSTAEGKPPDHEPDPEQAEPVENGGDKEFGVYEGEYYRYCSCTCGIG